MSDQSTPFTEMAARVDLNVDQGFGGAFVIVPPGDDAQPHIMLMLDNVQSPAVFWAALQNRAQMALQELEKQEQQMGYGGGLRR